MWDVVSAFDGSDRPADKGRKGEREKGRKGEREKGRKGKRFR